jgi:hypothetical protein
LNGFIVITLLHYYPRREKGGRSEVVVVDFAEDGCFLCCVVVGINVVVVPSRNYKRKNIEQIRITYDLVKKCIRAFCRQIELL